MVGRASIESANDTREGQFDLERHGCRTAEGICARITQRFLVAYDR